MRSSSKLPPLLVDWLRDIETTLGSYAYVVRDYARRSLSSSAKNDFRHSEAVHFRLTELVPSPGSCGLTPPEVFVLVCAAYLHDIEAERGDRDADHGMLAECTINSQERFEGLFPSEQLRNEVARICRSHTLPVLAVQGMPERVDLDRSRPPAIAVRDDQMFIRPALLAALLKVADELDGISERMLAAPRDRRDARATLSAIRVDPAERLVVLVFRSCGDDTAVADCYEHFSRVVSGLEPILRLYNLAYSVVRSSGDGDSAGAIYLGEEVGSVDESSVVEAGTESGTKSVSRRPGLATLIAKLHEAETACLKRLMTAGAL